MGSQVPGRGASYQIAFHALVGDDFFRDTAGRFIELSPLRSPILSAWGDELLDFLELFPPAAGLPYLADCARLEIARSEAFHAADAAPLEPGALRSPRTNVTGAAKRRKAPNSP